jgi:uncharacterized membrane protein YbhN (UPF0104 family)
MLSLMSFINSAGFYSLLGRKTTFFEAMRLSFLASAINRLFFTGTGYLSTGYLSRNVDLKFPDVVAAFLFWELCSVIFWLSAGLYFGVKILADAPLFLVITFTVLVVFVWFKRRVISNLFNSIQQSLGNLTKDFFYIIILMLLSAAAMFYYYYSIFALFNFHPDFLSALKIISISFAAGYLSPAPAGLGFKETGMVVLLVKQGMLWPTAMKLAVFDRIISTIFILFLGSVFGFDLIKAELKKRMFKPRD